MNKDNYKSAMSGVRHSAELTERIMNMTTDTTKKKIKMKPLLVIAACFVLLVTGIFGGSVISARINAPINAFRITAYAQDGKEVSLKDSPIVKTDLHLEYVDDNSVKEVSQRFHFDGRNVKSVTYETKRGNISYETRIGNDVKVIENKINPYNPETPFASSITLEIGSDESVNVYYSPSEAIELMIRSENRMKNLSVLPADTITVTVEYKDGTTAKAAINTSFDKDGNMLLEYQE